MDVVCVALTKGVTSRDDIYKFLEHLANGTQRGVTSPRDVTFNRSRGGLMPNVEFRVSEVLQEEIVLYLRPSVWIVVNRCKVKKVSFIEGGYRSSGKFLAFPSATSTYT